MDQPLTPNFYDFDFVSNIMHDFINRPTPTNPVPQSLFDRETEPLKVKHKKKHEEFNCSICFDMLACDPEEIDGLSKQEIKMLKDKFGITEPDMHEIKMKLKEKLTNDETEISDSVVIRKCGHA